MRSAATWMTWCYMEGSMCKVQLDEHIHSFGWGLVHCSWSYSPRTKWLFSLDETARDLVLCPHTLVWGRWSTANLRLLTGWTGRGGGTHMPFNMHAWIYLSRHVARLISLPFCSDHEWMSWTLVSRLMQSALCNGDPSCATELMGGRNKHGIQCSSSVCGKLCGYEILMVNIDWNYFLLLISFIVCFGSPVGELLGSYNTEEEAARYQNHAWVPAALNI